MYRCSHGCCTRTFVPLELACARTIHKFQGLSAGPVDEGKIKNPYECIICDPDLKQFEGKSLGLLYTAVSRATTLGDIKDGKNSAIYFNGKEFTEERIRRLVYCNRSNKKFKYAQKRDDWVAYLQTNEKACSRTVKQILKKTATIHAFSDAPMDPAFLHRRMTSFLRSNYSVPNM